jgi:hypothetical protein
MIKFEKVKPGMTLYDRHRNQCGNTTIRALGEWEVFVESVDTAKGLARVRWNGNALTIYTRSQIERLYDWSMYDESIAIITARNMLGNALRARKLTKAERAARAQGTSR